MAGSVPPIPSHCAGHPTPGLAGTGGCSKLHLMGVMPMSHMNEKPQASSVNIEFPLRLNSDFSEVSIAENISIRRLDDDTRLRLLGIEDATFDENGKIKSYVTRSDDPLGSLMGPALDEYDQLYSSNYVATLPTYEHAVDFNFALKLLGSSCTALFVGYAVPKATHFLSPPCYYGTRPLTFGPAEAKALSELLTRRRSSKAAKLSLLADMYVYAMSVAPRKESRFVELSVILEMLLLPTSSTELSYRFSLRMAKFFQNQWAADPVKSFKTGQRIYKTRSRLVHAGQDSELDEVAPQIEECVRLLLSAYVKEPRLFDEAALDALCIAV